MLLLLAVLWPIGQNWAEKPRDSFPLSHYPMFSHERQGKADITYLVGVTATGHRRYLPYELAGTGGMNQVRKTIAKRAKKDPAGLCRAVAAALTRHEELRAVRTVKILRSEFRFDRFFAGDETPVRSTALCACEVLTNGESVVLSKPIFSEKP